MAQASQNGMNSPKASCAREVCFLAFPNGAQRPREPEHDCWPAVQQRCEGSSSHVSCPFALLIRGAIVTILASSLALANADYTWRGRAICRDTDPDLFFPVGTTGQALLQIAKAKEVCGECPVSTQCLEYALDTNQDSGIWGGLDEEQRRSIRRQNAARQRLLA